VGEDEDLQAAAQGQVRRIRPEFVNYAKKAKRVDVRKLKENIWKELDIVVAPKVRHFSFPFIIILTRCLKDEEEEETRGDHPPPTDPNNARQFTQVISGLRRSYPKEKMEEISTSFCFICLLHLANERGLKIEPDADGAVGPTMGIDSDDKGGSSGKKVSDIWGLRIYRDPDATS
jgi:condensin complex subunit 2